MKCGVYSFTDGLFQWMRRRRSRRAMPKYPPIAPADIIATPFTADRDVNSVCPCAKAAIQSATKNIAPMSKPYSIPFSPCSAAKTSPAGSIANETATVERGKSRCGGISTLQQTAATSPNRDECRREAAHHSGQGMCRKARRTAFGTHFAFLHKTTPPCSYQKVCMEVSVHSGFICWRCCPPGYPAKASRRPESPSV